MESYPDQANRTNTGEINGMLSSAKQQGELTEMLRRLKGRNIDLQNQVEQIEGIKNRLITAPSPSLDKLGKKENAPDSGLIQSFANELGRYEYLLNHLSSLIEELEKSV